MPYVLGLGGSDVPSLSKEFEPEIDRVLKARININEVVSQEDQDAVPRTLRVEHYGGGGWVPDVIGWNIGPFLLSPRLHAIFEELEPGRHSYIPINIVSTQPMRGKTDHGTYFLLLPPPRIDALVIEETGFIEGYGLEGWRMGQDGKGGGGISMKDDNPCVVHGPTLAGHHFWQLVQHTDLAPVYMCSDVLWKRIRNEKITGWIARRHCQEKWD